MAGLVRFLNSHMYDSVGVYVRANEKEVKYERMTDHIVLLTFYDIFRASYCKSVFVKKIMSFCSTTSALYCK